MSNVTSIEEARIERLVREHLPLARRLARRYAGRGEPLDDLVQVANLGLVAAARRWDESRGITFLGYAIPVITGELKRHFRDHCWPLHVPRSMKERALKVHRCARDDFEQTGVAPTAWQLADRLQLSEREILDGLAAGAAMFPASLDAPVAAQPDLRLDEALGSPDGAYDDVDTRLTLAAGLRTLTMLERRVFSLWYLGDLTQADIAGRFGVSQMHISRLLQRSSEKLRHLVQDAGHAEPPRTEEAVPAADAARAA